MKKGAIQYQFAGDDQHREQNFVIRFESHWQFIKGIYKAYRSGCSKIYVFPAGAVI